MLGFIQRRELVLVNKVIAGLREYAESPLHGADADYKNDYQSSPVSYTVDKSGRIRRNGKFTSLKVS